LQKCVKKAKKGTFYQNYFQEKSFFFFCLEKKSHFSGGISILLEIPQKVNFQEQPRN
jgi:hypothetical protein